MRSITTVILVIIGVYAYAQNRMFIPNSNSYEWEVNKETKDTTQYFYGDVKAYQDDVFMFCDTAKIVSEIITAKGNVVFVQSDTIEVYADSVIYNTRLKNARLYYNVILDNVGQKLFTDYLFYDFKSKQATFQDTALMIREQSLLQSKSGVYNVDTEIATFYEDVILRDSLFNLRTDSLRYDMKAERAIFIAATEMKTDSTEVYCESGYHSFIESLSFLTGNPQIIKGDIKATGDSIIYDQYVDAMTIMGRGLYIDKDKSATGEYLYFNQSTDESIMKGFAEYIDSSSTVMGNYILRNPTLGVIEVYENAYVSNPPMIIEADSLIYDEKTEDGTAHGHVIWQDTSNATNIYCDIADYNIGNEYMKAQNISGRPYMMSITDDDTLYLAADTLFSKSLISQRDSVTIDTNNVLIAYPNAGIFKNDLQAICDSMTYDRTDSLIHLIRNPIMWSDSTQFVGDTIHLVLDSNKIEEVQIIQNGFISTELEEATFDQIKGRTINAFFLDGNIDNMLVIGNAESIYYIKDEEDAYIGANKTVCSKMHFYFINKELDNIRFYEQPTSVMTPSEKINPYEFRLEDFSWRIAERPLSLSGILVR